MAEKKEYVTSLVVESDSSQVDRLRDSLQQVSQLIQGIQSAGPVGGAQGGNVGWAHGGGGAGGGGGSGGHGGAAGGPGGAGSGGGQGHGDGNAPQRPGSVGPAVQRLGVTAAQAVAQQDESVLSTAASALPSVLPWIGAGLGAAAGALTSAALGRGRMALEFDKQRATTAGLLRGFAPGEGAGAGLGFGPGDAQAMAQAMAGSGLSGADIFARSARNGGSLFQSGLLAERMGVGAGTVGGFLSLFAPGGGGALPLGRGAGGISDAQQMQAELNVAIGGAMRAGLQNSDIPKYLQKIEGAVGAMADRGIQVDPMSVTHLAERLAAMTGRGQTGTIDIGRAAGLVGMAQSVATGGGDPMGQYLMLRAAGFGKPGVSYGTAMDRLERGEFDPSTIFREMQRMTDGTPESAARVARMFAPMLTAAGFPVSSFDLRKMIERGGEGEGGTFTDLMGAGAKGLGLGYLGTTESQRKVAEIEARSVKSGRGIMGPMLWFRDAMNRFQTQKIDPQIRTGMEAIMEVLGVEAPASQAEKDEAANMTQAEYNRLAPKERTRVDKVRQEAGIHIARPGKAHMPETPAERRTLDRYLDPKKGGTMLQIRLQPGQEDVLRRFFQFDLVDGSADGVPA